MLDVPLNAQPPVSLAELLTSLTTGAAVNVSALEGPAPVFDDAATNLVGEMHVAAEEELSDDAPPLDLAAAAWAAERFYRACQLLVMRDAPVEKMAQLLGVTCPSPRGPSTDFSVDLVFRFLPELHHRANRLAPGDPLVAMLANWARQWPLSSPGVVLEEIPKLETFAGSRPLWRLYIDRVTARSADDRWRDLRVAAELRADLGAFPELAPAMAESLRRAANPVSPPSTSLAT